LKTVYLVGIGTGVFESLTVEAYHILNNECDLYFGAPRMLAVLPTENEKEQHEMYQAGEILDFLRQREDWTSACVLLSGDVGFYSAARQLSEVLSAYDVQLVPGVSALSAFSAKLGIPWDEMQLCSLHGRNMNVIARIRQSRYTFVLLDGSQGFRTLCQKLQYYNMDGIVLHVGSRLGYPDEQIWHGTAAPLSSEETIGELVAVIAENPAPDETLYPELSDDSFIRGDVPMTKCEVRSLAIQKLGLKKDSVLYDIGAGTGSVSIQAALGYPDSSVFAIEREEKAADLIEKNKWRFTADNVEIIRGEAPDVLESLPAPTHAFIGGSGGRLKDILLALWDKNPDTVVVMTVIALETLAETVSLLHESGIGVTDEDIVQISVAKAKQAGQYHLMTGQNPVTIIRLTPDAT